LTQDTFVNAYRAFSAFRGESKISTWLCQIALNACKNRFRQRDRQREFETVSIDAPVNPETDSQPLEIPDWSQSPERALEQKELHSQIRRAIAALPEEYRIVLVLCDLEGHSYLEIARLTNLSLEAVKTRIHRGRLMIRRKLEGYLRD
jgi:RNA polymerase sigma-70 factor (ECF subfamily)